jgi:hypothetical protein
MVGPTPHELIDVAVGAPVDFRGIASSVIEGVHRRLRLFAHATA